MHLPIVARGLFTALLLLTSAHARRQPHLNKHRAAVAARNPDYTGPYDALSAEAACTVPLPPEVKAPKKNVWAFLTRDEKRDVKQWLAKQHFSNTTYTGGAELMTPNKTDVRKHC
jgi:hypothetical protein